MPLYDTQSQWCFFLVKVNILYYHYCTCFVFSEIKLLKKKKKKKDFHNITCASTKLFVPKRLAHFFTI